MEPAPTAPCRFCRTEVPGAPLLCPSCGAKLRGYCSTCGSLRELTPEPCPTCGDIQAPPVPKPKDAVLVARMLIVLHVCYAGINLLMLLYKLGNGSAEDVLRHGFSGMLAMVMAWVFWSLSRSLHPVGLGILVLLYLFPLVASLRFVSGVTDLVMTALGSGLPLAGAGFCLHRSLEWHRQQEQPRSTLMASFTDEVPVILVWAGLVLIAGLFMTFLPETSSQQLVLVMALLIPLGMMGFFAVPIVRSGGLSGNRPQSLGTSLKTHPWLHLACFGGMVLLVGQVHQSAFRPQDAERTVSAPLPILESRLMVLPVGDEGSLLLLLKGVDSATNLSFAVQEGPSGGSVNAEGRYQAPSVPGLYHIEIRRKRDAKIIGVVEAEVVLQPGRLVPLGGQKTPETPGLGVCWNQEAWWLPVGGAARPPRLLSGKSTTLSAMQPLPEGCTGLGQHGPLLILQSPEGPLTLKRDGNAVHLQRLTELAPREGASWTLLDNGWLVQAGGRVKGASVDQVEALDLATGKVVLRQRLGTPRARHGALALPGARLLLLGGEPASRGEQVRLDDWFVSPMALLPEPCLEPRVLMTPSQRILLLGGRGDQGAPRRRILSYNLKNDAFLPLASLAEGRRDPQHALLDQDRLLVAGGLNAQNQPSDTLELMDGEGRDVTVLRLPQPGQGPLQVLSMPDGSALVFRNAPREPIYRIR